MSFCDILHIAFFTLQVARLMHQLEVANHERDAAAATPSLTTEQQQQLENAKSIQEQLEHNNKTLEEELKTCKEELHHLEQDKEQLEVCVALF